MSRSFGVADEPLQVVATDSAEWSGMSEEWCDHCDRCSSMGDLDLSVPEDRHEQQMLDDMRHCAHVIAVTDSDATELYKNAANAGVASLALRSTGTFDKQSSMTSRPSQRSRVSDMGMHNLMSTKFSDQVQMRGVSLTALLQRCGRLLDGTRNIGAHREASHVIDEKGKLDFFITHSWAEGRFRKFLALALAFHGLHAMYVSLLVQLICFALISAGVLPLFDATVGEGESPSLFSAWCMFFGSLAFWATLFFAEDCLALAGFYRHDAFYDAACIDQATEKQKRQGISSITAYLWHSEKLLVLLSANSLRRIWTVFELTAFLAMKSYTKVIVQPVALAVTIAGAGATGVLFRPCWEVASANWAAWRSSRDSAPLVVAISCGTTGLLLLLWVLRLTRVWGINRAKLEEQINSFSFADASCSVEADRKDILHAVVHLAEELQLVDQCAPPEEACTAFETKAKRLIPECLQGCTSVTGMPFRDVVLVLLPRGMGLLDTAAADFKGSIQSAASFELHLVLDLLQKLAVVLALWLVSVLLFTVIFLIMRQRPRGLFVESLMLMLALCISVGPSIPISRTVEGWNTPSAENATKVGLLIAFQSFLCWVSYGTGLSCLLRPLGY
mmetsp:Transcript_53938/g.125880  ORF Transcript_53938/g.125880 Transcript_53938/m.125880 type:complete len:616 (-) Transcript_53938:173-2020(-)